MAKAEWDILLWTACPLHGCAMARHCLCGAALSWGRPGVCRCADGACALDLRDAPAPVADPAEVAVVAAIGASLSPSCAEVVSGRSLMLQGADLRQCIGAVRLLSSGGSEAGPHVDAVLSDPAAAVRAAGAVLSGWPATFTSWLGRRATGGDMIAEARRLHAAMGRAARDGSLPSALRVAVAAQVELLLFDGAGDHREEVGPGETLSLRAAARHAGIGEHEMQALIEGRAVRAIVSVGSGNGLRVPRSEVGKLSSRPTAAAGPVDGPRLATLSLRAASKLLGVGVVSVERLVAVGTLRAVATGRGKRVTRYSVVALLDRLATAAHAGPIGGRVGTWRQATCHGAPVELSTLLADAYSRKVGFFAIDRDAVGLARYAFSTDDLDAIGRKPAVMGARELLSDIRCQSRDPARLISAGLLSMPDERSGSARKRLPVTRASVAGFKRLYASTAMLAAERGSSCLQVISTLCEAGVAPMLAADCNAAAFWRRSEAEPVLVGATRKGA